MRQDAETIVLDFVEPTRAGRRPIGGSRQARLELGPGLLGAYPAP